MRPLLPTLLSRGSLRCSGWEVVRLVDSAPGPRSAPLPHPRIATAVAAQPGVFAGNAQDKLTGFLKHVYPEREKRTLLVDSMLNSAPPRFELLGLRNRLSLTKHSQSNAGKLRM